jgi:hypothetical protein
VNSSQLPVCFEFQPFLEFVDQITLKLRARDCHSCTRPATLSSLTKNCGPPPTPAPPAKQGIAIDINCCRNLSLQLFKKLFAGQILCNLTFSKAFRNQRLLFAPISSILPTLTSISPIYVASLIGFGLVFTFRHEVATIHRCSRDSV